MSASPYAGQTIDNATGFGLPAGQNTSGDPKRAPIETLLAQGSEAEYTAWHGDTSQGLARRRREATAGTLLLKRYWLAGHSARLSYPQAPGSPVALSS